MPWVIHKADNQADGDGRRSTRDEIVRDGRRKMLEAALPAADTRVKSGVMKRVATGAAGGLVFLVGIFGVWSPSSVPSFSAMAFSYCPQFLLR